MLKQRLSPGVRKDIRDILKWSTRRFGLAAAIRYHALIFQAFEDIQSDPKLQGSKTYPKILIDAARIYPISFSRTRVSGKRVGHPRHIVLYRIGHDTVFIARVLHETRDFPRHIPKNLRRNP